MSTILEQYRADITLHQDYTNGSFADFSGNSNDATPTNASWGGSKGRAVVFNGTNTDVSASSATSLQMGTGDMTYIVEFTNDGNDGAINALFEMYDAGSTDGQELYMNTDGKLWSLYIENGNQIFAKGDTDIGADGLRHIVVATIDRSSATGMKIYIDGIEETYSQQDDPTSQAGDVASSGNFVIGNGWNLASHQFKGLIYKVIAIKNVVLTGAEVAQVTEELSRSGVLNSIPEQTYLPEGDWSDGTEAGAWDMGISSGGVVLDVTGGGNNGVSYQGDQVRGITGNAIQFPGVDDASGIQVATTTNIDELFYNGGSIEAVVMANSTGGTSLGRIVDKSGWFLIVTTTVGGFTKLWFRHGFSVTNGDWRTTNEIIPFNQVLHIQLSYTAPATGPGTDPTLYINGVEYTVGSGLDETATPDGNRAADVGDFWIGSTAVNNGIWDGWIDTVRLYSGETSQARATSRYNAFVEASKGKVNYYADGKDWNESVASVGAGAQLENIGWAVSTGTWQIDDAGNADGTKQITIVTAGILVRPSHQAYGTWEFDINKSSDAESVRLILTGDIVGGVGAVTGYYFAFDSSETFILGRGDPGANTLLRTAIGTPFSLSTWYRIKITRDGGLWTCYYSTDGGVTYTAWVADSGTPGTNPLTDTTHTTSNFVNYQTTQNSGALIKNFKFSPIIQ